MTQHVHFIPEREMSTKMNAYNKEHGTDLCFIWNNDYCYLRDMNSNNRMDECETIDFVLNLIDLGPEEQELWSNVAIYHDMFRKVYILYWETDAEDK